MQERATPALRWSRALILAGVAFGLGLVGHASAGGLLPGPTGLVTIFAVTAAGCAAFLGRAAGTLRVTVLVVAGQAFIHAALTAASGHAGDPAVARPAGLPAPDATAVPRRGSLYDAYARASEARGGSAGRIGVPDWAQHLADDLTGPHAAMAVAHLVAAALVGLWLASGERTLWAVIRLSGQALAGTLRRLVARAGTAVLPARPTVAPRADGEPARRLHSFLLATTHARRGPPALLAA
jgi:hypothetical protein